MTDFSSKLSVHDRGACRNVSAILEETEDTDVYNMNSEHVFDFMIGLYMPSVVLNGCHFEFTQISIDPITLVW